MKINLISFRFLFSLFSRKNFARAERRARLLFFSLPRIDGIEPNLMHFHQSHFDLTDKNSQLSPPHTHSRYLCNHSISFIWRMKCSFQMNAHSEWRSAPKATSFVFFFFLFGKFKIDRELSIQKRIWNVEIFISHAEYVSSSALTQFFVNSPSKIKMMRHKQTDRKRERDTERENTFLEQSLSPLSKYM